MSHPTLTDVRAALSLLELDTIAKEVNAHADGRVVVRTPFRLITCERVTGSRWQVVPSVGSRRPSRNAGNTLAHDVCERLASIEAQGYGHLRIARVAADASGVWRVWAPIASTGRHALCVL